MKVAILKSYAKVKGGLEKSSAKIVKGFQEKGEEVTLLSPKKIWPKFLEIECFDKAVKEWIRQNRPDIVFGMDRNKEQTHFRAGNGSHLAFLQSRLLSEGKLKYLQCLCNPLHRKILAHEKAAFEYKGLKRLFVNSEMVRVQILERYAVDPKKIMVIHNGVEWDDFRPEIKKRKEFTFLFIGNGYLRKGLNLLIDAMKLLPSTPRLIVVGKDKNEKEYREKAKGLPIEFFSVQSNIRPFYEAADALILPSFYDPFANVTVEALAMGLFVVTSKFNGGCEVLTSETGHVLDEMTAESLAHALKRALEHPKTVDSALKIRDSVKHLDYSKQLKTLIDACYD